MSKLRLSEAIRLGAMVTKQGAYHFYISAFDHGEFTCALGAAAYAVGIKDNLVGSITKEWPFLDIDLKEYIYYLNDSLHMPREQIADFVEQKEKLNPQWYQEEEINDSRRPIKTE